MHLPDTDVTTDRPTALAPTGSTGWFRRGLSSLGIKGSIVTSDWLNDWVGAVKRLSELTGIALTKGAAGDDDLARMILAASRRDVVIAWDEQSTNVNGGTAGVAVWADRVLNHITAPSDIGASLTNNCVTLPAGTWMVTASTPLNRCNPGKSRLYNHTAGARLLVGTSENSVGASVSDAVNVRSHIMGTFTLGAPAAVAVQYYVQQAAASVSLGQAVGGGEPEVYTIASFERLAR